MRSTLWNVVVCRTPIPNDDSFEEKLINEPDDEECRHLAVHPDELQTTALIDGLQPCSQYIFRQKCKKYYLEFYFIYFRLSSNNSLDSEEKIVTEQTLCL